LVGEMLYGLDFTSRPGRRKGLTLAESSLEGDRVRVTGVRRLECFEALEAVWAGAGPWVMACDFPFGLPRDLIRFLGWPSETWAAVVEHLGAIPRGELESHFRRYREAHPAGAKYAHRATDLAAGSSSSMKLVNPPVGLMLYEGAPRLLRAGVSLPGLHAGDPERIALEGYPGLIARRVLGRESYKNDTVKKQTEAQRNNRRRLLGEADQVLGLRLELPDRTAREAVEDPTGDVLDAILCVLQAAWAVQRAAADYGLPTVVDPLEGWILAAGTEPCQGAGKVSAP